MSKRGNGFALVVVLWVLAGLTVVAVAVAASVRASAESVKLLRERVAAERAFLSSSSRLKFIASTAVPGPAELLSLHGRLYVDGRRTDVEGGEWLQLQDVHGLMNLNQPPPGAWPAFLLGCGARESEVASLSDALADYIDEDKLKRLNGAEGFEYRGVGLPPPRDAPLLSIEELWRVKGWAALKASWQERGCDALVTVRGGPGLNRNTAPIPLLVAQGFGEEQARAYVEARSEGMRLNEGSALGVDGASPFARMGGLPVAKVLRVRHQMDSLEWAVQYELELTPAASGGPWRLHELRITPASLPTVAARSTLPAVDFVISERERAYLNALSASPFDR